MKFIKVKADESLFSILNYINDYEYYIDMSHFVQFCIDYDYYRALYENFHIIKALIDEHNTTHPDIDPQYESKKDDSDSLL